MNLYRYCGGDPVNFVDPEGLSGKICGNNEQVTRFMIEGARTSGAWSVTPTGNQSIGGGHLIFQDSFEPSLNWLGRLIAGPNFQVDAGTGAFFHFREGKMTVEKNYPFSQTTFLVSR